MRARVRLAGLRHEPIEAEEIGCGGRSRAVIRVIEEDLAMVRNQHLPKVRLWNGSEVYHTSDGGNGH